MTAACLKRTNRHQYYSNRMIICVKQYKISCCLGRKVATFLDFQIFIYLDLKNISKAFCFQLSCFCLNHKLLRQINCVYLGDLYELENDRKT